MATAPEYKKRWRWAWAVWLVVVAASFAIMETIGLVRRQTGDTLSESTRHWLKAKPGRKVGKGEWGFIAALVAFVVWFSIHIATEFW